MRHPLPHWRRSARFVSIVTLGASMACRGDAGRGGTVIIGTGSDPATLFPPKAALLQARAITDLLFDKLAELGPSTNTIGDADFRPRLATRWEWAADSMKITFHVDPRARWHDGAPVSAADVRFAFGVYTDTVVGARGGADLSTAIDSISVQDSLTFVAWFKRRTPEQFYNLVSTLTPLPMHLLQSVPHDSLATSAFTRQPVGNGPFRLARWEPAQRVEVVAVDGYVGGRPKLDRVIWTFSPQASTLVQQLRAGELDYLEQLNPADWNDSARVAGVRVVRRTNYDYNFLNLNLRDGESDRPHPIFADRAVRRALTMALDRRTLLRAVFDTNGAVALGPFVRAAWSADTTLAQIGYDSAGAARSLDSLGWKVGADGYRSRGGRPLAFTILVPTTSAYRMKYAVLLQEQFRRVGVRADIDKQDFNAFLDRLGHHRFDAALDNRGTTPSPSGLRQSWTVAAEKGDGFNKGRYESAAFDTHVDSAISARDVRSAKAHYRAAYQTIVDDAPAIWLYEPPQFSGAQKRLQTGTLRADAWWMGIPSWTIAPGNQLPRDTARAKAP